MRPTSVKLGLFDAPNAALFRAAAAIGGAGALTLLTTAVDSHGTARRVIFTSTGNDTGITFTISGYDWNGSAASEVVTGSNSSIATSAYDYTLLTSITASGASGGTVSIGTSGAASTRPVFLDPYAQGTISVYVALTGNTQDFTVEYCAEDPNLLLYSPTDPGAIAYPSVTWVPSNDTYLVGSTTSYGGVQIGSFTMARVRTTRAGSSPTDFSITTFTQSMNAPY